MKMPLKNAPNKKGGEQKNAPKKWGKGAGKNAPKMPLKTRGVGGENAPKKFNVALGTFNFCMKQMKVRNRQNLTDLIFSHLSTTIKKGVKADARI